MKHECRHIILIVIATMAIQIFGCEENMVPDETNGVVFMGGNSYGLLSFDSYAGDQFVKIHWSVGFFIDFPPEPTTPIHEVRLYISSTSPDSGYRELNRFSVEQDSTIVAGLSNGTLYYFRLTTHDSSGRQVGLSRPVMTSPGADRQPSAAVPAGFGDNPMYLTSIAWDPEGERIAYLRSPAQHQNVYILDLSDLSSTQVTHYTGDNYRIMSLDWDPTGYWIAYCYTPTRTAGGIDYRIWLISPTGTSAHIVTAGRVDADPAWASGSQVVFCRGTYGPPNIPELWQVNLLNGNIESAITSDGTTRKYTPSVSVSRGVIVFSGEAITLPPSRYLYTVPLNGGRPTPLTPNAYWQDLHPSWSTDFQTVYFSSSRSGHFEIWAYHTSMQNYEQVTRSRVRGMESFYGHESPDGTRLALLAMGESPNTAMLEVYSTR